MDNVVSYTLRALRFTKVKSTFRSEHISLRVSVLDLLNILFLTDQRQASELHRVVGVNCDRKENLLKCRYLRAYSQLQLDVFTHSIFYSKTCFTCALLIHLTEI